MVYGVSDIQQYTGNAPHYHEACSMVVSGVDDTDVNALRVYLQNETKKITDFAWLLTDSTTESLGCEKCVIQNKKVGRPKTHVKGKKTGRHIHIIGISLSEEIDLNTVRSDFRRYIGKRAKKHTHLKQPKTKVCDSLNYISYMTRQADHTYKSSNFDWQYFECYLFDDKVT